MRFQALLLILFAFASHAQEPLGTAFSYQGELLQTGVAANGLYDFQFGLYDMEFAGAPVAGLVGLNDVPVNDGRFTVELEFGGGPFAGDELWLEISVREADSPDAHTLLQPRQKIHAVPYALHAEAVAMGSVGAGEIDASQVQRRVDQPCPVGSSVRSIGQDGSVTCEGFAPSAHNHSAVDITAGTLSTGRYSAYSDLSAEGYLDESNSGDLLTRAQSDARYLLSCSRRYSESVLLNSDLITVVAACLPGEVALGGGYAVGTGGWSGGASCSTYKSDLVYISGHFEWHVGWQAIASGGCNGQTTKTWVMCCSQ